MGLRLTWFFGKYIDQRDIYAMINFHKLPPGHILELGADDTLNFHLCSSLVPGAYYEETSSVILISLLRFEYISSLTP